MARRKTRKNCPSCGPRTVHFHGWQDGPDEESVSTPVWNCCNCDGFHPRRFRRTKGQIAHEMLKAQRAARGPLTARAEALDAEHARLIEQVNELHAKIGEVGRDRSRAWDAVDALI